MAIAANTDHVDASKIAQALTYVKPRRKALLMALAMGTSVADASRFAGYSQPKHGSEALADLRKKLPELMDALGMSTPDILRKLRKKMDAQKTITAAWNGEITDVIEVDDHGVQMDAIKLSLKLRGLLANDSEGERHTTITINNSLVSE